MKKYIDAEGVMRVCYDGFIKTGAKAYREIFALLESAPAEDVEKVVRCSDCKYLGVKDFAYGYCKDHMTGILSPNDYCSRGERRDD